MVHATRSRLRDALLGEILALQREPSPVPQEDVWDRLVERAAVIGGQRDQPEVEFTWRFAFGFPARWFVEIVYGFPIDRVEELRRDADLAIPL